MMKFERRKKPKSSAPEVPASELPVDYLKLVEQTLNTALSDGLNQVKRVYPNSSFVANGSIHPDEILLAITLSHGKESLAATTVYASADYNPNREIPSLQDTLAACLDSVGGLFEHYLDEKAPERLEQLLHTSMSGMEDAPFDWTPVDTSHLKNMVVYIKMDKLNPALESMADEWLSKNDPDKKQKEAAEQEEFLEERLTALKNAKSGYGGSGGMSGGGDGPIRH